MTRLATLALLLFAGACRGDTAPGQIEVAWTGADTGQLRVPATAHWCARDSLVEITGAAGDSGVTLVVVPLDTIAAGVFPVGLPVTARTRPSARMGIRWSGTTLIEGFFSLSGTVTLDSGPDLNGSVEATLKSVNDGRQISVGGVFRDIRIQPGSAESCWAPPPIPPVTEER